MLISRRDLRISIDHAHGKTFSEIAAEHRLSVARTAQIYTEVLHRLGATERTAAQLIGLDIQRSESRRRMVRWDSQTPEAFHLELKHERDRDNDGLYYQG